MPRALAAMRSSSSTKSCRTSCSWTTPREEAGREPGVVGLLDDQAGQASDISSDSFSDVTITLGGDLTPAQVERLEKVAASCPVRRSLEAGFEFVERIDGVARLVADRLTRPIRRLSVEAVRIADGSRLDAGVAVEGEVGRDPGILDLM